nr:hypothetical protein [Paenibacillus apiarius]
MGNIYQKTAKELVYQGKIKEALALHHTYKKTLPLAHEQFQNWFDTQYWFDRFVCSVGANWSLSHFPSQVSFQDRTNMNDIFFWYSDWWGDAANILGKPGPLTQEDKARISQLSNIVSKVCFA